MHNIIKLHKICFVCPTFMSKEKDYDYPCNSRELTVVIAFLWEQHGLQISFIINIYSRETSFLKY